MNELTVIADGQTVVLQQDDIDSPKFDCNGCMTAAEYVRRIAEYGVTTVLNNGDGTFTYEHISPHCICNISFTSDC